jgi:uncharacterized integral membrane protein
VNGRRDRQPTRRGALGGLGYRAIGGGVVAAVVLLFIVLNRDETEISFIVFSARTALWLALSVAAAGGFVAGFLLGRQRYRG